MKYELPPEVIERLGKNLRRSRKRSNLSLRGLSDRAQIGRAHIGKIEKGQRICRIDTLLKLASAMEVPVTDLLDGVQWIPAVPALEAGKADQPGRFVVSSSFPEET